LNVFSPDVLDKCIDYLIMQLFVVVEIIMLLPIKVIQGDEFLKSVS
jgi:hypothetical protein